MKTRLQKLAHLNLPENKLGSMKMEFIVNTLGTNGDDKYKKF